MDIQLKQLSEEEGLEIYKEYKHLNVKKDDITICEWEYVTFTLKNIWGQSSVRLDYAINREHKLSRQLTIGEAFSAGRKID